MQIKALVIAIHLQAISAAVSAWDPNVLWGASIPFVCPAPTGTVTINLPKKPAVGVVAPTDAELKTTCDNVNKLNGQYCTITAKTLKATGVSIAGVAGQCGATANCQTLGGCYQINSNVDCGTGAIQGGPQSYCGPTKTGKVKVGANGFLVDSTNGGVIFPYGTSTSSCFPGEAMVDVDRFGETRISDLRVGDRVRSAVGYEAVLGFLHQARSVSGNFLTIAHSSGEFRATDNHLIFTTDGSKAVGDVQIDEQILVSPAGPVSKVVEVRKATTSFGMFSPLTASGTVVVDGMVASIYGQPSMGKKLTHASAHAAFFPVRAYHALGLPRFFGESQKEELHPFAELLLPLQRFLSK